MPIVMRVLIMVLVVSPVNSPRRSLRSSDSCLLLDVARALAFVQVRQQEGTDEEVNLYR
jgi:hypothetical protein